ncbi:MAG: Ig-like domain-containing protein [Candidatus Riflebacteria bacterium]|nr:Ig-like domain-containing protein [Candidatus Riflebacteria bacterium]
MFNSKTFVAFFVSILCVLLTILAGCGMNNGNPIAPTSEKLYSPLGNAKAVFCVNLPDSPLPQHGNQRVSIKVGAGTPPIVTFKLILVNIGNTASPTTSYQQIATATASGTAEAVFEGLPAQTALGDIHIDGGSIASYTDFHGAVDLEMGKENILWVSPKSSQKSQDVVAKTIETIVGNSQYFASATIGLAAKILSSISSPSLDLNRPTIYSDALGLFLGITPDTTPPTVNSFLPYNGQSGVDVGTKITVVFSEAIDPTSLSGNLKLMTGSTTWSGSFMLSADKTIATYTPTTPLSYSTTYNFSVLTGLKDLAGNPLASTQISSFTTSPANTTNSISSFVFASLNPPVSGIIDEASRTIVLKVASGTTQNNLTPTIVHNGASVSPNSGVPTKFSPGIPVNYTVTAQNNATRTYSVTVWEQADLSPKNAWLDIASNTINNLSPSMEYSLNNGSSWQSCTSSVVQTTLSVGNNVCVRNKNDDSSKVSLGIVNSLSGPDLIAGNQIFIGTGEWNDQNSASPGESMRIKFDFQNIGNQAGYSPSTTLKFYISTDRNITSTCRLLASASYPYNCPVGICPGNYIDFTVPNDLPPGTYYIGAIVDADNNIPEMNDSNNATLPGNTAVFTIRDTTTVPSGAFKIVNSWGTGGWEKKVDGHYWLTYATMKKQEMAITYFSNNFSQVYKPTVLAVFQATHVKRDDCPITLGLGSSDSPVVSKVFQSQLGGQVMSGGYPFPNNKMAVDISEFASQINDYNFFLRVDNTGGTAGTINSLSIEYYYSYDKPPFKTLTGTNGSFGASAKTDFTVSTKNALNLEELRSIMPLPRRSLGGTFVEESPNENELQSDMKSVGVSDSAKANLVVSREYYGTGLRHPTAEEWRKMKKLRGFSSGMLGAGLATTSVDLSITQFFPPVGNQGKKGTCSPWSAVYYIHTYNEAREHNWNLSGTTWNTATKAPSQNLDKIFSPDFVYPQINMGSDSGSSLSDAGAVVARLGAASWQKVPYNQNNTTPSDYTTWPSEAAWREAAQYRGKEVDSGYWDQYGTGYFIVKTDAEINLLKSLLAAGYCVSTEIYAGVGNGDNGILNNLDNNDVIDQPSLAKQTTNHAQTIVGFKEGTSWNISNPD